MRVIDKESLATDKTQGGEQQSGIGNMRKMGIRLFSEWLRDAGFGLGQSLPGRGLAAAKMQRRKNRCAGFERQMHHRLSVEHLEERALLSADMQFQHIIFNPATGSAATGLNASGAIISSLAHLGSTSPPSGAFTPQQIQAAYGIERQRRRSDDRHRGRLS